jgi:hypothetical protein
MSTSEATTWRSRIVDAGEADPKELMANPANWRVHPKRQQKALEAILDDVGWVRQVIVNRTSGHVVDGHLRVRLAQVKHEPTIPVVYVELEPAEERMVLASLDPLATLAATDGAALAALSSTIDPESNPDISALVRELAGIQTAYHSSPSQDTIDARQDEMDHRFEGQMQKTFECECPHCHHEFAFGR